MKIVKPEIINDSVLTSNIVEPDYSRGEIEWGAYNNPVFEFSDINYRICGGSYRELFAVTSGAQNLYKITLNEDNTTTTTVLFALNAATSSPRDVGIVGDTFLIVDSNANLNFYSSGGAYIGQTSSASITATSKVAAVEDGYILARGTGASKPIYHWCTGLNPASFSVLSSFNFGLAGETIESVAYNDGEISAVVDSLYVKRYPAFIGDDDGSTVYTTSVIFSLGFNDLDNKFYTVEDFDVEGGAPGMYTLNADGTGGGGWFVGDNSALLSDHSIYQCLVTGTLDRPDIGAAKDTPTWLKLSPTNKYAMFGGSQGELNSFTGIISNQTESDSTVNITLVYPVAISSVCGFNIENCATVEVTISGGTAYNETITLGTDKSFSLFGLNGTTVTLEFIPSSGTMKIGEVVAGVEKALGESNFGGSLGLLDFSRVETDTFGNVTVTPRRKVKIIDYDVTIDTENTQATFDAIADITSTPAVYAAESEFTGEALITFGIYQDFRLNVESPEVSSYTLSVQGLT